MVAILNKSGVGTQEVGIWDEWLCLLKLTLRYYHINQIDSL